MSDSDEPVGEFEAWNPGLWIAVNDVAAALAFGDPEARAGWKNEERPAAVERKAAIAAGMTVEEYRADQDKKAKAKAKAAKDKIAKQAAKQKAADAAAAAADAAAETPETETDNNQPRPRPQLNNAVLGAGRFTPQGRAKHDQAQLWYIIGALVVIGGGAAFYSYSRRKK